MPPALERLPSLVVPLVALLLDPRAARLGLAEPIAMMSGAFQYARQHSPVLSESDTYPISQPKPDTQELYNIAARLQAEEDDRRYSDAHFNSGMQSTADAILAPLTPPSQDRSRSSSVSISSPGHNHERIDAEAQALPADGAKLGRRRPLDPLEKAWTAFYRKLGVCEGCRTRKVKVNRCAPSIEHQGAKPVSFSAVPTFQPQAFRGSLPCLRSATTSMPSSERL